MTKRGDIHQISRKKSHSQHEHINISALQLTDFDEFIEVGQHWFYFKLDDKKYQMMLMKVFDNNKLKPTDTITVLHGESTCPNCGQDAIKNGFCRVLMEHAEEVFQKVIPHSKHRLRLMTKNVHP